MVWRIERFSREETTYWLSKVSVESFYGKCGIEWAKSGLRLMLAGQQKDGAEVEALLEKLRKEDKEISYEEKLIEDNFPCQQVGAETKRERGASSALPPLHFLHVWWGRRPLMPSHAAVLGSILPADTDPKLFLRELGIVKKQGIIGNTCWTLVGKNLELIEVDFQQEFIPFSTKVQKVLEKENERRSAIFFYWIH